MFDAERIVAVAAVANKENEYQDGDARQLTLLTDGMWRLVQRQRAEAALRESRAFLQKIIDGVPDAVMVIDRDYRISLANRAVRDMAGGADLASGRPTCHQVSRHRNTPCPEEEDCPCPLRQVIASKSPAVVTHTHFDADGSEVLLEIVAAPIFDESGEVVQVIEACRDVTARVRAEEQARQGQAELAHVARVGTMGEMASGLAHELTQPLAAIINYLEASQERIRSGTADIDALRQDMEEAAAQAERAGGIIERIREFVRKGEPQRSPVDVDLLVQEAADLVKPELRRQGTVLHLRVAGSLPIVKADAIQIEQVIVNLMRNGAEAMAEKEMGKRELTVETGETDDSVEVVVSDTGPGLPNGSDERLFHPFFTTKPGGLGLGLSICRTIIESHGGQLQAASNPGGGATFRFTLPTDGGGVVNGC